MKGKYGAKKCADGGEKFFKIQIREQKIANSAIQSSSRKISLFFFNEITGVELRIIITVPYGKVKKEKKNRSDRGKKDGLNGNQFPRGRSRNVASPTERKNKRSVALATGFKRGRSIPPLTESVVADTSSPKRGNKLE